MRLDLQRHPGSLPVVSMAKTDAAPASAYPNIAFRSSFGFVIAITFNLSCSTFTTAGVRNAGRLGPNRMFLIPR